LDFQLILWRIDVHKQLPWITNGCKALFVVEKDIFFVSLFFISELELERHFCQVSFLMLLIAQE